jgi:hypothetical protein
MMILELRRNGGYADWKLGVEKDLIVGYYGDFEDIF